MKVIRSYAEYHKWSIDFCICIVILFLSFDKWRKEEASLITWASTGHSGGFLWYAIIRGIAEENFGTGSVY
jgi:hypothetical protein